MRGQVQKNEGSELWISSIQGMFVFRRYIQIKKS
jgi:hypothetical protein